MRIAQVHWAYFPVCGGVESHIATVMERLGAKGHDTTLFCGTQDAAGNENVRYSPALDLDREATPEDVGELMQSLTTFDRIHFHNLHYFDVVRSRALFQGAATLGRPLFHTIHETWQGAAADVITSSAWSRQFVISDFIRRSLPEGVTTTMLPYGVDPSFVPVERSKARGALKLPDSGWLIVHPARLLPWKAPDVTLRAFELLHRKMQGASLIITDTPRVLDYHGEIGEYRAVLMAGINAAREEGLDVSCRSFGRSEIPFLLAAADVVVYPTRGDEPFGLVPAEAILCKRVPIVTESGGLTETVTHEVNGLVVGRDSPEELSSAILRVLTDDALRISLIRGGTPIRRSRTANVMLEVLANAYEAQ